MDTNAAGRCDHGHNPHIRVALPKDAWQATYLWINEYGVGVYRQIAWIVLQTTLSCWWYLVGCSSAVAIVFWLSTTALSVTGVAIVICFPFTSALVRHLRRVIPWAKDIYCSIARRRWDTSCCYWVAHCHCTVCKGRLVALVSAQQEDQGVMELIRLTVSPALRRHGLGQNLSSIVFQFAKANGYHEIRLTALDFFTPAINLYSKLGYRVVRRSPYRSDLIRLPISIYHFKLDIATR